MQPDESKTVRLGWIALDVVVDAEGAAISTHVTLHGENGSTAGGAMVFAQVAEAAKRELSRRVLEHETKGEAPSDAAQHAATCANDGPAETSGCGDAASATAPQEQPEMPVLDPLTIMEMARERVLAHGGSFADAVQDLLEARKLLSAALSSDCGRSEK